MITKQLCLIAILFSAPATAAEDNREITPAVMGSNRDYFAKIFHETYGDDARFTDYVSCKSTDPYIGLDEFYLFRPRPPAAPVLVTFNRDYFMIGNIGTVRYFRGEIEMQPGSGLNGTSEAQRITVEPLLAETFRPVENIAEVFLIPPTKTCAYAESAYLGRAAVPAPK